jgi:hypothetical protein
VKKDGNDTSFVAECAIPRGVQLATCPPTRKTVMQAGYHRMMVEKAVLRIHLHKVTAGRIYRHAVSPAYVESFFQQREIKRRHDGVIVTHLRLTPERIAELAPLRPHMGQFYVERKYQEAELAAASLLRLRRKVSAFMAEEATGSYDLTRACPDCGYGWRQSRDLEIDLRALPKRASIAQLYTDEFLLAAETAERLTRSGLSGFRLRPISNSCYGTGPMNLKKVPSGREFYARAAAMGIDPEDHWRKARKSRVLRELWERALEEHRERVVVRQAKRQWPKWLQIEATGKPVSLAIDRMSFGESPWSVGPICPRGHTLGWDVLSEAYVHRSSWSGADYCVSRQVHSMHEPNSRCTNYPVPLTLVSAAFYRLMKDVPGIDFEVAHLL